MAGLLAAAYGVTVYAVDARLEVHLPHLTAADQPMLYKWTHTPWDELWMQPAAVLMAEAVAAYQEHCALVLADVAALPTDRLVLVEGTCLLPGCVAPHLAGPHHGLWVVPTETFQRTHYPARGAWVHWILSQCREPETALRAWMERDATFARWVAAETAQRGLALMVVDGRRTAAECAAQVAAHFGWSEYAAPA
jgi:hypothetical protein